MSRQPENTFIASIHKKLPKEIYRIKNNNMYNSGQPDCWYSGDKADLWIEYKFEVLPKRDDTIVPIDLSPLQREWLTGRHVEGRSVGVVVGCKEGGVWFPGATGCGAGLPVKSFRGLLITRIELADLIRRSVSS